MCTTVRSDDRSRGRDVRVVDHCEQLRLDEEQVGDAGRLDRCERRRGLHLVLQHDRAAAEQRRVDEQLRQVGQRPVGELPPCGVGGRGDGDGVRRERPEAALRDAGGAAGGDDDGEVVGTGPAGQRRRRRPVRTPVEPQPCARHVAADHGDAHGGGEREQVRGLGERDEQVRRDELQERRTLLRLRQRRQVHGGGADEVRGVTDGERVRAVRRVEGDEVAAADPEAVEGAGIAVGRRQEVRRRRRHAVVLQDGAVTGLLQRGDQFLQVDLAVHECAPLVGFVRPPIMGPPTPMALQRDDNRDRPGGGGTGRTRVHRSTDMQVSRPVHGSTDGADDRARPFLGHQGSSPKSR